MKSKGNALLILSLISLVVFISFPIKLLTITGSSMEPTLTNNDMIIIAPDDNYEIGDTVTYKHEIDGKEYLFTHRIIDTDGNTLKTKGDALQNADNYIVKKEDVVGEVVLILPFLGAFIHFAASFGGWVGFILIPSAILITMEARKIWRWKSG